MTTHYRHTETGTIYRPGQIVDGQQTHARMSDEAWADLRCEPYTPPPAEPVEPLPARYSKLKILRALSKLGQRETFLDWLDSDRALRAEWDAAQYIAADDPTFGEALQTFVSAVSLSPEEADAILAECVL